MTFHIGQVRIKISFLFCAVITLIVLFDNGVILPAFIAVCAHEGAHLFAMLLFGVQVEEVALEPFGILIRQKSEVIGRGKRFCIALAGCALNLLCFFAFFGAFLCCGKQVFLLWGSIHFVLFLVNILPIEGLDGAVAVTLILREINRIENGETALKLLSYISCGVLFAFGMIIYFKVRHNPSLCLLSLFLFLQSVAKKNVND